MHEEPGPPEIPEQHGEDLLGLEHEPDAQLTIFMAGNQFMAVPELLEAFQRDRPQVRRIFCETLPPRLELRQILAGGALYQGRIVGSSPDVYTSVSGEAMQTLAREGFLAGGPFVYLHNRLMLMVAARNPARIRGVADLGREEVRVSQPSPENEDIAAHILEMYRAAGGEALVSRIMREKRSTGTTVLTTVHHRETPRRILAGEADVGPVWATEVASARKRGLDLEGVEVGEGLDMRERVSYHAAALTSGRNPENAAAFLSFLAGSEAARIFRRHGFSPHGRQD